MSKGLSVRLRNIVAFCVLMENNRGIVGKSPEYITEKFVRYVLDQEETKGEGIDNINLKKFNLWIEKWDDREETKANS